MNSRHFSSVVFSPVLSFCPHRLVAQAQNESVANHEPHYYDINDWDIELIQ